MKDGNWKIEKPKLKRGEKKNSAKIQKIAPLFDRHLVDLSLQ